MLTVLDEACNACVRTHFMVTNACQGCLARPCMMNCGKKAIEIKHGRAHIDEEKCVNCGLCMQNCPYHAIIKIPVPCEEEAAFVVEVVWQRHENGIDLVRQFTPVRRDEDVSEILRHLLRSLADNVAYGHEFDLANLVDAPHVLPHHVAAAYQSHFELIHA